METSKNLDVTRYKTTSGESQVPTMSDQSETSRSVLDSEPQVTASAKVQAVPEVPMDHADSTPTASPESKVLPGLTSYSPPLIKTETPGGTLPSDPSVLQPLMSTISSSTDAQRTGSLDSPIQTAVDAPVNVDVPNKKEPDNSYIEFEKHDASQEGGIPVDSKEGLSLLSGSKLRQPSDSSSDTDTDSDSDSTSSDESSSSGEIHDESIGTAAGVDVAAQAHAAMSEAIAKLEDSGFEDDDNEEEEPRKKGGGPLNLMGKARKPNTDEWGELEYDIIDPQNTMTDDEPMEKLGTIEHIIKQMVTIKPYKTSDEALFDRGTVICTEDRKLIGTIYDTTGTIYNLHGAPLKPLHLVKFRTQRDLESYSLEKNSVIYYLTNHAVLAFPQQMLGKKGNDATGEDVDTAKERRDIELLHQENLRAHAEGRDFDINNLPRDIDWSLEDSATAEKRRREEGQSSRGMTEPPRHRTRTHGRSHHNDYSGPTTNRGSSPLEYGSDTASGPATPGYGAGGIPPRPLSRTNVWDDPAANRFGSPASTYAQSAAGSDATLGRNDYGRGRGASRGVVRGDRGGHGAPRGGYDQRGRGRGRGGHPGYPGAPSYDELYSAWLQQQQQQSQQQSAQPYGYPAQPQYGMSQQPIGQPGFGRGAYPQQLPQQQYQHQQHQQAHPRGPPPFMPTAAGQQNGNPAVYNPTRQDIPAQYPASGMPQLPMQWAQQHQHFDPRQQNNQQQQTQHPNVYRGAAAPQNGSGFLPY